MSSRVGSTIVRKPSPACPEEPPSAPHWIPPEPLVPSTQCDASWSRSYAWVSRSAAPKSAMRRVPAGRADQRSARGHLLAGTGHAYLQYASLALAAPASCSRPSCFSSRCARRGRGTPPRGRGSGCSGRRAGHVRRPGAPRARVRDGVFPWVTVLQPTFVVGLLLQIPFALAAYVLARLLLRVTGALARLLRRRPGRPLRLRPRLAARRRDPASLPRSRPGSVRAGLRSFPSDVRAGGVVARFDEHGRREGITRRRHVVVCALVATVVAAALAAAAPPSARAHAAPPRDDARERGRARSVGPRRLQLRFDEHVGLIPTSVRMYDSDAVRVDVGDPSQAGDGHRRGRSPRSLPDDTYTVAWRVLSEDSHPIRGAFVFSVGEPVRGGVGVADRILTRKQSRRPSISGCGSSGSSGSRRSWHASGERRCWRSSSRADDADTGRLAHARCLGGTLAVVTLGLISLTGVKVAGLGLLDVAGRVHRT